MRRNPKRSSFESVDSSWDEQAMIYLYLATLVVTDQVSFMGWVVAYTDGFVETKGE